MRKYKITKKESKKMKEKKREYVNLEKKESTIKCRN